MECEIKEGYIRVSDVLGVFYKKDDIDDFILEKAQKRGTYIHYWIQSFLEGIELPISETWSTYTELFQDWYTEFKPSKMLNVKRLYSENLKLTGEVDNIAIVGDRHILIDYKTSKEYSRSWPLQVAAYAHLLKEQGVDVDEAWIVHLDKQTSKKRTKTTVYKYDKGQIENNLALFMDALKLYKYFYL